MTTVEAERLHDGLVATLRAVASVIDGSTFEERKGYRLLACPSVPLPPFNSLSIDGPDDASVAAELASAVVTMEEDLGAPCWIVMREGSAPACEAEARRLGFTEVESSPGMAMTPTELRSPHESALELEHVRDRTSLETAWHVAAAGFEIPRELIAALHTERMLELPALELYLASVDGVPVSTGLGFGTGRSVGLFDVATPPEHRRKGYAAALSAAIAAEGFAAGDDLAWLIATPMGEPVYSKLGFREVERYLTMGRPQTPA